MSAHLVEAVADVIVFNNHSGAAIQIYSSAVLIESVDSFAEHLVIYKREGGLKTISITRLADGESHQVSFPEPVYTYFRETNP